MNLVKKHCEGEKNAPRDAKVEKEKAPLVFFAPVINSRGNMNRRLRCIYPVILGMHDAFRLELRG